MTFLKEQFAGRDCLVARYSENEKLDSMILGMLNHNQIPGLSAFSMSHENGELVLRYDIHNMVSMKELFSTTVNRRTLLNTFMQIIKALEVSQDYMISPTSLVYDTEYIYLAPQTFRLAMICSPIMDYCSGIDEKNFFKTMMFHTIFNYDEPCDHVARIMNYLNGTEFDLTSFRELLESLGASSESTEEVPTTEEVDPFFGIDLPTKETEPFNFSGSAPSASKEDFSVSHNDFHFSSSTQENSQAQNSSNPLSVADELLSAALQTTTKPETSKVDATNTWDFSIPEKKSPQETPSPLSIADDLLSAALQNPQPTKVQKETPLMDWDFSVPESKSTANNSDPLSVADALLSAALSGNTNTPSTETKAKNITSQYQKPSEATSLPGDTEVPAGGSARSRRSRARRDNNSPAQPEAIAPQVKSKDSSSTAQESKKDTASSDPFDFLNAFSVPEEKPFKSDAMKVADALLSSLDIPVKEATPPVTDPFADWTPTVTPSQETGEEDDFFSDFTTPRVSSRKKSAKNDGVAVEHTASKKTNSRRTEDGAAIPTANASVRKQSNYSKTNRDIADDLLSAAIQPNHIKSNANMQEAADLLSAFSKPASKTAAMKEAEALLDGFGVQQNVPSSPMVQKENPTDPFSNGSAPFKKTAAMLEAEAILDSLDFTSPAQEQTVGTQKYSATGAEPHENKPLPAKAEPAPVPKDTHTADNSKRGGFFSKLRKKEEAPAPVEKPVPQVLPYYGADGETTVLNVAQQMPQPATPYLLRSSNQENIFLSKPIFRIGKDRDFVDYCVLDNSAISRRHANFIIRNGDIFVIDTNSTNHTFVNGVMIRSNVEVKLTHGDEIRLANEDFMLYCAGTL